MPGLRQRGGGADDLAHRTSPGRWPSRRLFLARPAQGRELLRRRWLRLSLSPLQERLAARLAARRPATADPPDGWWAGVAVLLAPAPDSVLLIRRADRAGDPWSGQIGLPGGRLAPEDPDLLSTAIRETREEVGVDLAGAPLLGTLDDVAPRTPLPRVVVVRPFVFALAERPALDLSGEVAQALWVELADLARAGVYQETEIELRGERRRFPAYRVGQHLVWGLTERILSPLVALAGVA